MEISGSTNSAQAVQQAFARNAARGKRLANPETDPQFEKDMAELPSDKQDVGVQTSVIKTKDKMLGDLLDIVA